MDALEYLDHFVRYIALSIVALYGLNRLPVIFRNFALAVRLEKRRSNIVAFKVEFEGLREDIARVENSVKQLSQDLPRMLQSSDLPKQDPGPKVS